jgi:hypothetical protein
MRKNAKIFKKYKNTQNFIGYLGFFSSAKKRQNIQKNIKLFKFSMEKDKKIVTL